MDPKNQRKQSLDSWDMVCKPKDKGGLGILNLRHQNDALLMKHLHKFYNRADIPWVRLVWQTHYRDSVPHLDKLCGSFWWKYVMKLSEQFLLFASCHVQDGRSVSFWLDPWLGQPFCLQYPRVFSFVKEFDWSVFRVHNTGSMNQMLHLPLSEEAHEEYLNVIQMGALHPVDHSLADSWTFTWGEVYSSSRRYGLNFAHLPSRP